MRRFRQEVPQLAIDFEERLRAIKDKGQRTNCEGDPGPYMDYSRRPTEAEAEDLCAGCPLMQKRALCLKYGQIKKYSGVWGGRVLHEGRTVRDIDEEDFDLIVHDLAA